ncbi:MAG: hypothetical protein ACYDDO_00935 [Acidiferrobacterales bacterium]
MTRIDGLLTFSINSFAVRSVFLPPLAMQVYIALMIVAVAIGTLVERLHQGSTKILIVDSKRIF